MAHDTKPERENNGKTAEVAKVKPVQMVVVSDDGAVQQQLYPPS